MLLSMAALAAVMILLTGCATYDGATGTVPTAANDSGDTVAGGDTAYRPEFGMAVGDDLSGMSDEELDAAMADIAGLGFDWLRFDMAWSAAQPDGPDSFRWERFDRIVDAAGRHGIRLLPVVSYTPAWARPDSCTYSFKCAPADPTQYADYMAALVRHYAPRGIHAWEIWNEPNISAFWQPAPDAAEYTELLKQAYLSIKREDPEATVVSGGLSPSANTVGRVEQRDFLEEMYASGAGDYFDALGYHPFSYPVLPSDVLWWSAWSIMSDVDYSIRSIMLAHGDGDKKIWATEYGAPSAGPRDDVDEARQALAIRDAIDETANKPWLATLFFFEYKDLSDDPSNLNNFFGLIRYDGSRKPSYFEVQEKLDG
jgi:hypothetical protein